MCPVTALSEAGIGLSGLSATTSVMTIACLLNLDFDAGIEPHHDPVDDDVGNDHDNG
jgi:hypothetical protein